MVEDRPFTAEPRFVGFELGEAFLARGARRQAPQGLEDLGFSMEGSSGSSKWLVCHETSSENGRFAGYRDIHFRRCGSKEIDGEKLPNPLVLRKKDPKSVPSILTGLSNFGHPYHLQEWFPPRLRVLVAFQHLVWMHRCSTT